MSAQTPYARLTGPLKIYVAPAAEAIPNLDASPAGNWVELGLTDGEQSINWTGALTGFTHNQATGMLKHVRPAEGLNVAATLVHLTLEHIARVLSMATSDVVTTTSGALNVKKLPFRRGFTPTRYAMLLRGGAIGSNTDSPYGAWPGQRYIPQGVFDGEPSEVRSKDGSPGLAFTFMAEWYESASAGEEFGYLMVQSS